MTSKLHDWRSGAGRPTVNPNRRPYPGEREDRERATTIGKLFPSETTSEPFVKLVSDRIRVICVVCQDTPRTLNAKTKYVPTADRSGWLCAKHGKAVAS